MGKEMSSVRAFAIADVSAYLWTSLRRERAKEVKPARRELTW